MGVLVRITGVVGAVLAAGLLAPVGGAQGEPGGRTASVLALTVAPGESLEQAPVQRIAFLLCAPVVWGTHPRATAACEELTAAGGDFAKLAGPADRVCTQEYAPVTVAADGTWNNATVHYRQTFPNACAVGGHSVSVFDF
ncbi:subtilase-type protease inhibitor [Nocardia gipuzkoensis]